MQGTLYNIRDRMKMSAAGFETVSYAVAFEDRVGYASPLAIVTFDAPLLIVTHELHSVPCPPPQVYLAGESDPKFAFRTQLVKISQQRFVKPHLALPFEIVGMHDETNQAVPLPNQFNLLLPEIDR